jgi:hypothetical protein
MRGHIKNQYGTGNCWIPKINRKGVIMEFKILNRFSGEVQFTAEIDCKEDEKTSVKIGLAVKWAIKTTADLSRADLSRANLSGADLSRANLSGANLSRAKAMVKIMGVEQGNTYWKRFDVGLKNNEYQFKVGLNELRSGEVFADDERVTCSYPGFHFASRSWCAVYYSDRPLEARIRIPMDAKINEPWATDGKASADKIEIIQVFDVKTGTDVTDKYR